MTLEEMLIKTANRKSGFEFIIDHLSKQEYPIIVETGCARWEDNFAGDGMSTLIFDTYMANRSGEVYSVDITQGNVNFARSKVSARTQIACEDSLSFLWRLRSQLQKKNLFVSMLYLDSYDLDHGNPHPSALHHMQELTAILPVCNQNTLIGVDDNYSSTTGKGIYIADFMKSVGIPVCKDGLQIFWKLP